jgi:hypothetical protein
MPTPVTPNEIKTLIPRFGSSMCGKFIPTITNFIRRFADFYEWMFNEDGSFTEDFKTDLCALGCTAVGLCPTLNLAPIMVGRNAAVDLTFTVSGPVPYDWELFRDSSPSGAFTTSIASDTGETDSTLAITDATAVNTNTYYYKLVVKKAGCTDATYITGSVTPNNCYVDGNDFAITLTQGEAALTIALGAAGTTPIPDGTTVNIWRSTVADAIGTQIVAGGVFAGGAYTYTDDILTIGTRYYYTVKVQQTGGCTEFSLTKDAYAISLVPMGAPVLTLDGNYLSWQGQAGIAQYIIQFRSACGGGNTHPIYGQDLPLDSMTYTRYAVPDPITNECKINLSTGTGFNCVGRPDGWLFRPGQLPIILHGSELDTALDGYRVAPNQVGTSINSCNLRGKKGYYIYVTGIGNGGVITHFAQKNWISNI